MQLTDIARVAHESQRAMKTALGDPSTMPWDQAPREDHESTLAGVQRVVEQPTVTAAELHEHWCGYKQAEGWKYGPEKDPEARTHPCMVSFFALPLEQQAKDELFIGTVKALLPLLDQERA